MAASRHVQPKQLKMFMSANEIMAEHGPNPGDIEDSDEGFEQDDEGELINGERLSKEQVHANLWSRKAEEAKETGLHDSIAERGMVKPVNLYSHASTFDIPTNKGTVGNGHHRLAVMAHTDPDKLMPVLHHPDRMNAIRGGYKPRGAVHNWGDDYGKQPTYGMDWGLGGEGDE